MSNVGLCVLIDGALPALLRAAPAQHNPTCQTRASTDYPVMVSGCVFVVAHDVEFVFQEIRIGGMYNIALVCLTPLS